MRAGEGAVWVTNPRGVGPTGVVATTRLLAGSIFLDERVLRYGPSSGSGAVIVAPSGVWIPAHDVETVWRLPPRDG